jgi:hypothetical protein
MPLYLIVWKCRPLKSAFVGVTCKNPDLKWEEVYAKRFNKMKTNRFNNDLARTDPEKDWDRSVVGTFNNVIEAALNESRLASTLQSQGYKLYKRTHGILMINGSQHLTVEELIKQVQEVTSKVPSSNQ